MCVSFWTYNELSIASNAQFNHFFFKTLYADSPIDSSLFSLYVHQNYTQFCNEMEECEGVSQWLSWVDSSGGEAVSRLYCHGSLRCMTY
jgi:hypothetical protein